MRALTDKTQQDTGKGGTRTSSSKTTVALKYDGAGAPTVVATGAGHIAEEIQQRAKASGVPVVEDPKLALLLAQVPLGEEIPPALYRAVAEVLVFVLRLELAMEERA